ncbi:macrophage mannose receptor 1 isoform X3 [Ixodes scapularis]
MCIYCTSATQLKRNLGNCDEGWVAFGSKCYFFASNTSRLRFYDARQHCIRQNAQLVTIPSVQVQRTSATQLKRNLGNCDEGWVAFGSKCYFFASNTSRLRFYDARQHCIRQNAQLVTIPSVQVQQFLLSHLGDASTNVWIGLKTITGGSKWLDGSPIAYKNWFWGQPKLGMSGIPWLRLAIRALVTKSCWIPGKSRRAREEEEED